MNRFAIYFFVTLITLGVLISTGCGGGSSSNQTLSAAQAQAVSQELATATEAALQASVTSGLDVHPRESFAKTFHEKIMKDESDASGTPGGCSTSDSGTTCNYPVSYTGNCPQGGTIGVTGDFDFTLNSSGDGSDSSTLTITPTNCATSAGTGTITFNGEPNITLATQVNFQDDAPVYPITLTETGGISYGPNPSGSCQVNATLTITSEQSCTVSGSICGQTLSGSCVPLPPSAVR